VPIGFSTDSFHWKPYDIIEVLIGATLLYSDVCWETSLKAVGTWSTIHFRPHIVSFHPRLDKSWYHSEPLLLVLITKVLSQSLLLFPCPGGHLSHGNSSEKYCAPTQIDKTDTDPGDSLEHVIWTSD